MLPQMKILPFTTMVALLAVTACKKSGSEPVRREDQPDLVHVSRNDPAMSKAVQTARNSVETFITALKAPAAGQGNFTVKKPFKDGVRVEHIWLSNASFDGARFTGRVDNEPVDVTNVKMGQIVTAAKDEISDWFYIDNGRLVGGYTIRVLYSQMSPAERRDFKAHAGFQIE